MLFTYDRKKLTVEDIYSILKEDIKKDSRIFGLRYLIEEAIKKHDLDFEFKLNLCIEDTDKTSSLRPYDYSLAVDKDNYSRGLPSFLSHKWEDVGIMDYTELINSFEDKPPLIGSSVGWVGNIKMHRNRRYYVEEVSHWNPNFIGLNHVWTDKETRKNYMTLNEQVENWEYLLDIEGWGWSARVPILLSSPRIVFMQEREWHEWYWEYLKPWKHYVPIGNDFADLVRNYNIITKNHELQARIKKSQAEFAKEFLTLDANIDRMAELIKRKVGKI